MLNKEQELAAYSTHNKVLCLAGAGTGKTTCLIARIRHLVEGGVSPSSILVLTFTNAAAFEMESRYKQNQKFIHLPDFFTFHAFCYNLIKTDESVLQAIGYSEVPDVADANKESELFIEAKMQTGINLSTKSWDNPDTLNIHDKYKYDMLSKAMNRLLKKHNLITFDKLCYSVCELFVNNAECILKYKDRYKHIMVDEFQDTDPRQNRFVQSFENSNLFIIGDALQSLYAFRGADSTLIKSYAIDSMWEVHKLTENYRSTVEICEFANENSEHADPQYRTPLQATRHGEPVQVESYPTRYVPAQNNFLRAHIRNILELHNQDTAILCRTNREVDSIRAWLQADGVELRDTATHNYIYKVVRSAVDDDYFMHWLYSMLTRNDMIKFIKTSATSNIALPQERINLILSLTSLTSVHTAHADVSKVSEILSSDSTVDMKYIDCCNLLQLPIQIEHEGAEDAGGWLLQDLENREDIINSGVYVGTVHSAKGLEYDTVILPNVNTETFKLNGEENLNIYYVGITRAKNHLYIFKEGA